MLPTLVPPLELSADLKLPVGNVHAKHLTQPLIQHHSQPRRKLLDRSIDWWKGRSIDRKEDQCKGIHEYMHEDEQKRTYGYDG